MKKLLSILAIALVAVSCFSPYGEFEDISDIPGVEPGKGDNNYNEYTTYRGALLPDPEFSDRDRMVELLKLIGKQKSEIDDTAFLNMLSTKLFECVDRYMYIDDPDEPNDRWSDARDWVGGTMFHGLVMYDNGEFAVRYHPACPDNSMGWYDETGYEGWHEKGVWEYDSETNTLYTSEDKSYAAKVLYFDGEFAVLEGFVYPMWLYNPAEHDYKRNTPMELYGFKFSDGKEDFLNGFELTSEEYWALREQWYVENMYFEGKEIPYESARECFDLLKSQQADEINDEMVVKALTKRRVECKTRFVTMNDADHWASTIIEYDDLAGRVVAYSDMLANEDGTYQTRVEIHPYNEKYKQATADKCYGWHSSGEWSYDADTNTLTTIINGKEYKAVVAYFDYYKSRIILRGHTGFVYDASYDDEILDCTYYDDGIDNYLDGYMPYNEFVEYLQSL